jgi:hypothetical protein
MDEAAARQDVQEIGFVGTHRLAIMIDKASRLARPVV